MKLQNLILAASLAASAAAVAGCGDSGFDETEVPQLTLGQETPEAIGLSLGNGDDSPAGQTEIEFANTGEADLEVSAIRWEARPDRLVLIGDDVTDDDGERVECDFEASAAPTYDTSGECASDSVCWRFGSDWCRETSPGEMPLSVPAGQSHVIDTALMPGEGELDCPEAPTDREVPDNYCGELVIETNANNSGRNVEEGVLRVFFTYNAGSGAVAVTPASINFAGVAPGSSDSRELSVSNIADEGDLTIDQIRVQEYDNLFTLTGPNTVDIAPGSAETWTLEFNAPANWDGETIGTNIEILSSAGDQPEYVPVTASSQQDRPAIKVDPAVLNFEEGNSQTLTISNEGTSSLVLQSFTAGSEYSFEAVADDEEEANEAFDRSVPEGRRLIQGGDSREFIVHYTEGDDNGVDTLAIDYVYYVDEESVPERASVTLLGSAGDQPVGMLAPDTFSMLAYEGNTQPRSFVVRNVGTQPLEITAATLSEEGGDFSLVGDPTGTIAAGEIKEVSVEYNGSDDQMDNVNLTLESNTAGEDMSVLFFASPGSPDGETEAQITPNFTGETVEVGTEARFSALQSTVSDSSVLDSATWVLLERPAGSSAFVQKNGAEASFFPDVAGDYKISVLVDEPSGASSQVSYPFTAE